VARLARANLRVTVRRTASVAAPMLVTVGIGASLLGVTGVLVAASAADARGRYSAPLVVLPTGGAGLGRPALDRVAGTPGVAVTVAMIQTTVHVVAHRAVRATTATGIDGAQAGRVLRLGRVDGDPAALRGESIAVGRGQAADLGWRLGDVVPVVLADGQPARLRVVALFDGSPLAGGILLPAELARDHDPRPEPDAALVALTAGADPRAVSDALRPALAAQGAVPLQTTAWLARSADAQRAGMRLGAGILAGVALAYTLLAVVNTVVMAAGSRTGEFGRLRLAGVWRRQVLAMVSWEATGVTAVGVGLGAVVTAVTVVGAWLALRAAVPRTPLTMPWAELAALGTTCLVLTLTTMLAATWVGLRTRPIDAAGTRE
jgi:putative ABC transport system permease protein